MQVLVLHIFSAIVIRRFSNRYNKIKRHGYGTGSDANYEEYLVKQGGKAFASVTTSDLSKSRISDKRNHG